MRDNEKWSITHPDVALQPGETVDLHGGEGETKWATIDIDNWIAAVIVLGETQAIADERARRIVEAMRDYSW